MKTVENDLKLDNNYLQGTEHTHFKAHSKSTIKIINDDLCDEWFCKLEF